MSPLPPSTSPGWVTLSSFQMQMINWLSSLKFMRNTQRMDCFLSNFLEWNRYLKLLFANFHCNVQVFVGDYETIKVLFNNPQVQNRGHTDLSKNMLHQKNSIDRGWDPSKPSRGVILSQGDTWMEQRRSMLRLVNMYSCISF